MKDPYRKTLGNAMRWYDCLHVELDRRKEAAISQKFKFQDTGDATAVPAPSQPSPTAPSTAPPTEKRGRHKVEIEEVEDEDVAASRHRAAVNLFLLNKCPACFGLKEWGRSFAE